MLERKKERVETVVKYKDDDQKRTEMMYLWGCASTGALGIASYLRQERANHKRISKIWRPARLKYLDSEGLKVKQVDCGYGYTVMICRTPKREYKVYGTGINTDSQLGYHYNRYQKKFYDYLILPVPISIPLKSPDSTKLVNVAAGRAHTLVLTGGEGVYSFGNNSYGQCGRQVIEGETYMRSSVVHQIRDLPDNIPQIVCGQDHSIFITDAGEVYSCGLGADGQTGLETHNVVSTPTLVKGDIQGEKIVQVSCASDCVLALSDKGEVFGWGNSEYNQFAAVTDHTQLSVPRHISPTRNCGKITQVAAAGSKCAVLNDKGEVFVWGFGILGVGPSVHFSKVPTLIPPTLFGQNEITPDALVTSIASGVNHFMAQTNKYELYSWGKNKKGCLGLAKDEDQFFPLRVAMPAETRKIVCGVDHCVALCRAWS